MIAKAKKDDRKTCCFVDAFAKERTLAVEAQAVRERVQRNWKQYNGGD